MQDAGSRLTMGEIMKTLLAAFAAALLVAQFIGVAEAGGRDQNEVRLERLLQKLEALTEPEATGAAAVDPAANTVTRRAALRIYGTITRRSAFTLPLRCSVGLLHIGGNTGPFFLEDMSKLVTFNGNTGICDITIPFRWQRADDEWPVEIDVGLYTDQCVCAENEIERSTGFELPDVPLPAEGTTPVVFFARDMSGRPGDRQKLRLCHYPRGGKLPRG